MKMPRRGSLGAAAQVAVDTEVIHVASDHEEDLHNSRHGSKRAMCPPGVPTSSEWWDKSHLHHTVHHNGEHSIVSAGPVIHWNGAQHHPHRRFARHAPRGRLASRGG